MCPHGQHLILIIVDIGFPCAGPFTPFPAGRVINRQNGTPKIAPVTETHVKPPAVWSRSSYYQVVAVVDAGNEGELAINCYLRWFNPIHVGNNWSIVCIAREGRTDHGR